MIFKTEEKPVVTEVVESDAMHIISFVGQERADIIFYLAKILQERNTKEGYRTVLLIDNSDSKDLFHIVNKEDDYQKTLKRLTFMEDIEWNDEYFRQYAFVIIYHGMDVDFDILNKSDLVVCQTDYNPNHYMPMKDILSGYTGEIQLIYRDWFSKKIKESDIEACMNIPNEQVEMRSYIKFDGDDFMASIQLMQNGNQRVNKSNLSGLMIETLSYLAEKITGADEKTIEKMVKNAK